MRHFSQRLGYPAATPPDQLPHLTPLSVFHQLQREERMLPAYALRQQG